MASPLPQEQFSLEQFTPAQSTFWTLLQDEQNHLLSRLQLCHKAGYKTTASWYTAVRDEHFRKIVEALGVVVYRERHEPEVCGIVPLAENPDVEWEKNIVDVRRLVSDYPKHLSASAFRLNFSFLSNPSLKAIVKRYLRARLGFWQPSSLKSYLKWLKPFLWNLNNRYPDLASFAALTRAMMEPVLTASFWMDERGSRHPISRYMRRYMLIAAESMFMYMQRHEWEEAPLHCLIYDEDRPSQVKKRPRPIPESVLDQLQAHVSLLRPYAHNLITILSVTGLRGIDALHLGEGCLEFDATGDPRLHWYNHKLKRDGHPLPVTTEVAEAIKLQQTLVKDIPDLFGKKYLFRTKRGLYKCKCFCDHLNEVAKKVPIRGLDGQVYHFKPHAFRHTVGTQMINNGMGIADVMTYLDHMSPEMTLRYAEIDDNNLKQKFKALVLSGQAVGGATPKRSKRNWKRAMKVN
jgi:integrase